MISSLLLKLFIYRRKVFGVGYNLLKGKMKNKVESGELLLLKHMAHITRAEAKQGNIQDGTLARIN